MSVVFERFFWHPTPLRPPCQPLAAYPAQIGNASSGIELTLSKLGCLVTPFPALALLVCSQKDQTTCFRCQIGSSLSIYCLNSY